MQLQRDWILEGARPNDVEHLRELISGRGTVPADALSRLEAKGWVQTAGGTALLTLTGRTLADR